MHSIKIKYTSTLACTLYISTIKTFSKFQAELVLIKIGVYKMTGFMLLVLNLLSSIRLKSYTIFILAYVFV